MTEVHHIIPWHLQPHSFLRSTTILCNFPTTLVRVALQSAFSLSTSTYTTLPASFDSLVLELWVDGIFGHHVIVGNILKAYIYL